MSDDQLVDIWAENLKGKDLEWAEAVARGQYVRNLPLGVEGFEHFYWCIWGQPLQPYARRWVEAFASGKWTILECFRGSGKSTNLSITFPAYCLGKEPWTSVLIVQANDDTANKTSATIASIIEHFRGWQACFPNIVPDPAKGWGAKGYSIKDTDADYGLWLEKCAKDHMRDPSFVGAGITSADIVGMHPKRLFFDDIHDIKNSAFPKERRKIVDTVSANILPVITKPGTDMPFIGVSCTPWDPQDAYHALYNTGLFQKITTPILWFHDDGPFEFEEKPCFLAWPDGFPIEKIQMYRKAQNMSKAEFARMYLCDLEAAKSMLYKWYSYPEEDISLEWPMGGGVDYASVYLPTQAVEGGRSHFALARIAMHPSGGAIVVDGIVEQCTQTQAETYVHRDQNTYPGWQYTVIESDGVGREFIQLIQRNRMTRYAPMKTSDVFRGTKERRQYEVLSPLLERAALRVSTADTPFLNCFRSYLESYPNIDAHAPEWDVADAVFWATFVFPQLSEMARTAEDASFFVKKKKKENPFVSLGR